MLASHMMSFGFIEFPREAIHVHAHANGQVKWNIFHPAILELLIAHRRPDKPATGTVLLELTDVMV